MGVHDSVPPLSSGGRLCVSAADKATCLNVGLFAQCSVPAASCQPKIATINCPQFPFTLLDVSTKFLQLASLSPCKASGHDDVSNRQLKECATGLAEPLCHIFNLSLSSGVYPQCWNKTVI